MDVLLCERVNYLRLGQSGRGSDGNEGVLCIPQNSSITGTSASDCLVSYPGDVLSRRCLIQEMQSVHSTTGGDWAIINKFLLCLFIFHLYNLLQFKKKFHEKFFKEQNYFHNFKKVLQRNVFLKSN